MKQSRSSQSRYRPLVTFFLTSALCWTAGLRAASAAPIKVACIGEHTTHGHAFPPTNRESQPVGMQEYPAQLQTMLGPGYDVRNFGDCCGSVLQGYAVQETHPYVLGANNGDGPGYKESIAFLPDIVIIGSWGRHDWGLNKAAAEVWSLSGFQDGYDDLVKRYQALSSHPKIFVSYPIPILNGQGDVPDQGVTTSSVLPAFDFIANKYNLPIIDLYHQFLNHKELYRQPPDPNNEGEGEHANPAGLTVIAKTVYAAMQADLPPRRWRDRRILRTRRCFFGRGGASGATDASLGVGGGAVRRRWHRGQGTAGEQAGSPAMPQSGGSSNAGASASPAADTSGCSCSFASQSSPASRTAALALGGLALLVRRRQRVKIRS